MSYSCAIAKDFRRVTREDIFLARLKNEGFAFMNVQPEDQLPFLMFCMEHGFLKFHRISEARGSVAIFWAVDDFICEFADMPANPRGHRHTIEDGDLVEWTWSILNLSQFVQPARRNANVYYSRHYIWTTKDQDESMAYSKQIVELAKKYGHTKSI